MTARIQNAACGSGAGTRSALDPRMMWLALLALARAEPAAAEMARPSWDVVVDLSDDWVPRMLSDDPSLGEAGRPPYHGEFIRLANHPASPDERFLELYGIPPSFAVVGARLTDEERHRCHAGVARTWLASPSSDGRAPVLAAQE